MSNNRPEDKIYTSKDGRENRSWDYIAYAEGEDKDYVLEWGKDHWESYYDDMEAKYPGFERPWNGIPGWNSHPAHHREEIAERAKEATKAWEAQRVMIRNMENAAKTNRAVAMGPEEKAAVAAREVAAKKCAEKCAEKAAAEYQQGIALERRESTGGRRRTSNAKYYNKRRGTKRRRAKQHRSKKHRSKKHRS